MALYHKRGQGERVEWVKVSDKVIFSQSRPAMEAKKKQFPSPAENLP